MAGLVSEGEPGLYGAACRCGRRRGVAGCHYLLMPPYLSLFSVPPAPGTPHRVPLQAGDSITVHITLTPNYLNSIEVSLLWRFTPRRATWVALLRARRWRFGLTPLRSVAAPSSPTAGLGWGRTLRARSTHSGRVSGPWKPAAPQTQLPIPPGTRSSALTGGQRLSAQREAPVREGSPNAHTRSLCGREERGKSV